MCNKEKLGEAYKDSVKVFNKVFSSTKLQQINHSLETIPQAAQKTSLTIPEETIRILNRMDSVSKDIALKLSDTKIDEIKIPTIPVETLESLRLIG